MKKLTELLLTGVLTLGCGGEEEGKTELVGCGPGLVSGFDQYTGEKVCIPVQGSYEDNYTPAPSDYNSSEPASNNGPLCEDHILLDNVGYNIADCSVGYPRFANPKTCTITERRDDGLETEKDIRKIYLTRNIWDNIPSCTVEDGDCEHVLHESVPENLRGKARGIIQAHGCAMDDPAIYLALDLDRDFHQGKFLLRLGDNLWRIGPYNNFQDRSSCERREEGAAWKRCFQYFGVFLDE